MTDVWRARAVGITQGAQDDTDFDALFLAHYDAVYGWLMRLTGSSQEAEDLAQETFLRLYRQRFPAGQEHHLRAWLYRVATNLAYNALRRAKRSTSRDAGDAASLYGVFTAGDDPDEALLQREERELVRRVLASLPSRQAELLLLRHAGLSYAEVAQALGVAPGSVGTLLARAESAFEAAYRALDNLAAQPGTPKK